MPNELQELAEIVQKRSLRIGEFTLSSGKKAPYYLDCRMTTLDPRGAYLIARLVLAKMRELHIQADAIGGLTLGADPMAAGQGRSPQCREEKGAGGDGFRNTHRPLASRTLNALELRPRTDACECVRA